MIRLLCSLLLVITIVCAQQKRPRIALVLEGGAALGFAHVGVLEWLEANRIPIDMIAGSSMGGLIGGLYAAGHSPKEIRDIARQSDWEMLVGGDTAFRDLAYRRKEDRLAFPNRIELGVSKGLQLPAGFNEGHQIGLMLSRLTIGYPSLKSFDELPTPFRCVSVDLVSGKSKVWDSGPMNEALRSTMSIPALFSPVRKGNGIYVDGGLLDNLPVDVAKRMGADLIIAVHLSKGPVDPKLIGSLVDVMGRSVSVVIGASEMRTISMADVVLVAELEKFNLTDYHKSEEITAAGTAAAELKANVLRRFALDDSEFARFQTARQARVRKAPADAPKFVSVIGASDATNEAVRQRLAEVVKERLDTAKLENELTKVIGLGPLASLSYQQSIRNGETGLEVHATHKSGGPVYLTPGFEINGIDTSDTRFSLGARITWLNFLGYRGEWRNDLWFGSRFGVSSEFYRPIRPNSRFFIAPRLFVDSNPFDLYVQGNPLASYRLRQQGAWLDSGMTLNRFSEIRLGFQFNFYKATQRIGPPVLENVSFHRHGLSLRYRYEGQDDAIVARRGWRIYSRAEHFPTLGNSLAEVRTGLAQSISKQNSLIAGVATASLIGPRTDPFQSFNLGGPQLLGSYGLNEILARNYALATVGLLHEVKSQPNLLGSKVYLAGLIQGGRTYDIFDDLRYPVNGTGAVILRTLFGPVFIGASYGDRGHRKWFFGLGKLF